MFAMQCNHQQALDQFIKQTSEPPVKIAVIGGGCSLATEPTAGISHYWQIPQVHGTCISSIVGTYIESKSEFKSFTFSFLARHRLLILVTDYVTGNILGY